MLRGHVVCKPYKMFLKGGNVRDQFIFSRFCPSIPAAVLAKLSRHFKKVLYREKGPCRSPCPIEACKLPLRFWSFSLLPSSCIDQLYIFIFPIILLRYDPSSASSAAWVIEHSLAIIDQSYPWTERQCRQGKKNIKR